MRGYELIGKFTVVQTPESLECPIACASTEGSLGACATGPVLIAEITAVGTYPTPDGPKPQVLLSPRGLVCGRSLEPDRLPPDVLLELPELTD